MGQIDWGSVSERLSENDIENAGRQILNIYKDIVVTNVPDEKLAAFELVALTAGEAASYEEARQLADIYRTGVQPLKLTDLSALFFKFVEAIIARFRQPLCIELQDNKDIVLLAPTIITLLSLPVEIAALAVPVSAILSRVGIAAICKDVEAARDNASLFADLGKIHKENLRYLEAERARQLPGDVPPTLDRAIAFEEQRINALEKKQKSV